MESQPRSAGGVEGKSSDEIVFELAEGVINAILKVISTEEAHPKLYQVIIYFVCKLKTFFSILI